MESSKILVLEHGEHIEALRVALGNAGFDAKTLGFPKIDDRFLRRVYEHLREAVNNHAECPKRFMVDTSGLFTEQQELVHFKFHFCYNATANTLDREKLTVRLHDIPFDIPLVNSELPHSHSIYQKLAAAMPILSVKEETPATWKRSI